MESQVSQDFCAQRGTGHKFLSCWPWSSVSHPGISNYTHTQIFNPRTGFEGGGALYIPLEIHQKYLKTIAVILDWAGEWEDNENYWDYRI